jgi:hypothetical protein
MFKVVIQGYEVKDNLFKRFDMGYSDVISYEIISKNENFITSDSNSDIFFSNMKIFRETETIIINNVASALVDGEEQVMVDYRCNKNTEIIRYRKEK